MKELTIEQAKKNPANFMYIWATPEFLAAIKREYALIIRQKQVNERLLLNRSAEKFGTTQDAYIEAIRAEFIEQFKMTPYDALVKLALGKKVCGKDWEKGIYGIGAIRSSKFKTGYSVDKTYGTIIDEYGNAASPDNIIYGEDGNPFQISTYDNVSGITYISEKSKSGDWFAKSYSNSDGDMFNASGSHITGSEAGSVWETIDLSLDWIQRVINWILSLFNISTSEKEQLTAENTLPQQKEDGFVYESGLGEAGGIMLLLVAGGAFAASGTLGARKRKSK